MAKVTMPLLSGTASGKIAGSMVHFGWKGRAVVRQLVTPSNPKTGGQGDQRLALGTAGKALKVVQEDSAYIGFARAVTTSGQTWISWLAQYIVKNFFPDASAYDTVHAAYAAHSAKSSFDSNAATLGMVSFDISYKTGTNHAEPGFQLYLLAKLGVAIHAGDSSKFNASPFTTALASWTSTEVTALVAALAP